MKASTIRVDGARGRPGIRVGIISAAVEPPNVPLRAPRLMLAHHVPRRDY